MNQPTTTAPARRWRASSIALILTAWAILQLGGLFTPGLLDDVDSVYIQVAREMLQRHDFVTPTIDGIRFFDKPPLMYWMAAGSMHLFGVHDWAARLPLALGVLALLLAVYALGIRFYSDATFSSATKTQFSSSVQDLSPFAQDLSPFAQYDRGGLYAALAMATALGPYLYTRFYIPDILIALWMTLSVHLFLIALDRISTPSTPAISPVILSKARSAQPKDPEALHLGTILQTFSTTNSSPTTPGARGPDSRTWVRWTSKSPLIPMLGFASVTALNLLTKGLIGIVFPIGFALFYLAFTRNLKALKKLHLPAATLVFAAIAAPWHVLAALRNPPIAMPAGVGLPAHAGWAWFYLYNEHIARFLGRRIPHDYGQVPIPLFWLLLLLWLLPWVAFLPAALLDAIRTLRTPQPNPTLRFDSDADFSLTPTQIQHSPGAPFMHASAHGWNSQTPNRSREAALSCILWAGIILGFFTLSSRQEYYHLPALPALALLVGGLLAAADAQVSIARALPVVTNKTLDVRVGPVRTGPSRAGLRGSLFFLVPLGTILFLLCGYLALAAPSPHPGVTLNDALSSNPAFYNLSLGHVFDLTTTAMGFFRGPLLAVSLCMLALGPISHLIRRRGRTFAANLLVAAAMTGVLLSAHVGLVRFYPILGSKDLALAIDAQCHPGDLILIDGELTSGSTLLFYTPQSAAPVLLVNGRVNGPWFGSFWPDAPPIFLNDAQLHRLWSGPHRIFLLTYHPTRRAADLALFGLVHDFADSGGKTILTNK